MNYENEILSIENQDLEIQLFLQAIYLKYGYDFRGYSKSHIKRRILNRLCLSGLNNISEMQNRVIYDESFFHTILHDFSINVTEMFRDPSFYRSIKEKVIPILKTYPFIKIWHAGCSTGEEVYSMAILLKEEGLLNKSEIYATDFNEIVLKKAEEGIYPIENIKDYTYNYHQSGGTEVFSNYYTVKYNSVIFDESLKKKIIFADHNLVTDGVFGEMNLIICRNVLIYFNKELQNHVIKLFYDSLCNGGILGLGSKESLRFSEYDYKFQAYVEEEKIYRKKFSI